VTAKTPTVLAGFNLSEKWRDDLNMAENGFIKIGLADHFPGLFKNIRSKYVAGCVIID
jgi:hypothetical protein